MKVISLSIFMFLSFNLNLKSENVTAEFVKEVILENLTNRVPGVADPKVYGQIAYEISMGKGGRIVEQVFEGLKPENIKNDMIQSAQFFVLKRLAPVVGVYAETAMSVYSMVETYVNDWQDWAVQNRLTEFKEDVLSKTTVKELDEAYTNYIYGTGDSIGVENRMGGILYHKRPEVLAKMKEGYELRRKELEIKERKQKLIRNQIWAKIRAEEEIEIVRKEAERKTSEIINMMKVAKIPITKENFTKYLKNKDEYIKLKGLYQEDVGKKIKAGEKVSTGDEKIDNLILVVANQKTSLEKNDLSSFSVPDYSGLIREYGLNSDRLLTNNISAGEYVSVKNFILQSANILDFSCKTPLMNKITYSSSDIALSAKEKINLCSKSYENFYKAIDEIEQKLNGYGKKLKEDLISLELRDYLLGNNFEDSYYNNLKQDFFSISQAKKLDYYNGIMDGIENTLGVEEDYDHWVQYSWEGKKNPTIEKMKKIRDSIASIAGAYETLANIAEEKSKIYKSRFEEIEKKYNDNLTKYDEIYSKNASMAEYFSIPRYDFKKTADLLLFMNKKISDPMEFINNNYIEKMKMRSKIARKIQEKWNNEISLNLRFVNEFMPVVDEIKRKAKAELKSGSLDMTKENYAKIYNSNFKKILERINCSLHALEEKREGFVYKDIALNEKCYFSIDEHKKYLLDFQKLIDDYSIAEVYEKRDYAYAKVSEIDKAVKSFPLNIPCDEALKIINEASKIYDDIAYFTTISKENLSVILESYKKAIDRIVEIEGNMKNFICQSSSIDENKKFISSLPWVVSQELEKYCIDPNIRRNNITSNANYKTDDQEELIKRLYEEFKDAYQSKSVSKLINLVDEDWVSPEGENVSDLRDHFSRIFSLFNEIKLNISDFHIIKNNDNTYTVNYLIDITSKIYSKNIKRVEKSSVSEIIIFKNNKPKIFKTQNGSYWLIK
ncbi:MAG: hypothetical protein K6357_02345 [Elusimicrobiota bacterium]